MKGDRQSVYDQRDHDHHGAMIQEFRIGTSTLQTGESRAGAARFAADAVAVRRSMAMDERPGASLFIFISAVPTADDEAP